MFDNLSFSDFMPDFAGDPALWTGIAGQIAGTALKARANRRVIDEQNARMAAYMQRQRALQAEAQAATAVPMQQMTAPNQEAARAQIAAQQEQAYLPTNTAEAEYIPANPGKPAVVQSDLARQMTDAIRKGRENAKALAGVTSYGRQSIDNNIMLNRSGQDVGRTLDFAQGNSSILPYQMQGAQRAGRGLNMASDIANGIGQVGILASLTKQRAKPKKAPITFANGGGELDG